MKKKLLIVHNKIAENAGEDELDVLDQAKLVEDACLDLGYLVERMEMNLDLGKAILRIREIGPDILFNLVETLDNKGEFAFVATSVFSSLQLPYSGSPLVSMLLASNKVLAKQELRRAGLPTPNWYSMAQTDQLDPDRQYILKPTWEEGSLDLDDSSVFWGSDSRMKAIAGKKDRDHYFIEEYVDGREYNISMLAGREGPEVLPLAEMQFLDYPKGKPRILGYTSKWKENSFEYSHTRRTFEGRKEDRDLHTRLISLCKECWHLFSLKGYARVDFRVSLEGAPFIIDINANPCLSTSGGFSAACQQAGFTQTEMIRRILEDAYR
ncbi:MAG: ATP-grasp domain-containing protein [bacterium]